MGGTESEEGRERDQGLTKGRRINALFELCKIAAWERGGVCLNGGKKAGRGTDQGDGWCDYEEKSVRV